MTIKGRFQNKQNFLLLRFDPSKEGSKKVVFFYCFLKHETSDRNEIKKTLFAVEKTLGRQLVNFPPTVVRSRKNSPLQFISEVTFFITAMSSFLNTLRIAWFILK